MYENFNTFCMQGLCTYKCFRFWFCSFVFWYTVQDPSLCIIFSEDASIHQVLQLPQIAAVPNLQAGELNAQECMPCPQTKLPIHPFQSVCGSTRHYGAITTQHLCHTSPHVCSIRASKHVIGFCVCSKVKPIHTRVRGEGLGTRL